MSNFRISSLYLAVFTFQSLRFKDAIGRDDMPGTLRAVVSPGRTLRSVRPGETTARRVAAKTSFKK